MIIIIGDTDCYYCINKLSGLPLVHNICATVLSTWLVYFRVFILLFYFCYSEGISSCINSAYGDMRFKVYLWGFPYLDYPLDVPILLICNLSFITMCLYSWHSFWYMLLADSDLSIHACLPVHATWHYLTYSLGWFLTTLDLYVQISELGPSGLPSLRPTY